MEKIKQLKIGKAIIKGYQSGESCSSLGKRFPVSSGTISKFLKKNGIVVINRQNQQIGLNKTIFSNIDTEEKAYWLGMLYADGYMSKEGNRISLTLKELDKPHLMKFVKFLGGNLKIAYRERLKAFRVSVRCKQIHSDLVKLGCVPNKTWKLNKIPHIPHRLKIHFLRGYFDGDGCITFGQKYKDGRRGVVINIVSNKAMLDAICGFLKDPRNYSKKKNTEILMVRWSGVKAAKLLKRMYENSTIYLERKNTRYNIFKKNGFAAWKSDFPSY
tara:strand:- start:211 stop:1026 length:816 start_codon:yes stop_codon:yes gene_type:complete